MLKAKKYNALCALALVLCMSLGSLPALAQSQASSGQIAGSVTDSTGAAVGEATVKVTSTQTGLERAAKTSDDGLYRVVLLPPGIYNVTAEASGFQATTVNNIEVVVGRTSDINITLGAGGVQEVVNVTAGAVQIQTTRSEADAVQNEIAISNLPINGRRFQDFVTLTPTAQVDPQRGQISLAGQRGINGNINVDGVDYNNPFFGGIRGGERANTAFTIPQESIKEFQVVAAGYSAEFGRSTGGVVNAVTKSGTNDFHGSAFYLIRPEELASSNLFFDALELNINDTRQRRRLAPIEVSPAPTQQQFGGSFGGPIKKDKIFFFAAYEQQRFRNDRNVFFANLASATPGPNTQEALTFYQSLEEPFTQTNDAKAFLGRVDYEINSNHRFNLRYSRSTNKALNANSRGNPVFPTTDSALSNNGTERDRTNTVVGQMASFFTTSLVNELRGQYTREDRPRDANALQPTVETSVGNYGTVAFLGQNNQFDWRFQIADSLTWTKGNHTFKFGGEYNHVFIDQTFGQNQFGRFQFFSSTDTILDVLSVGGTTANRFDNRSVSYLRQIGNLRAAYSTDELAFFGQDSWRIRPNLTINYGLRWEAQYNPDPELGNQALIDKIKGFRFPGGHTVDPTRIADSTDQFGPRFGFAWDPWGDTRTVIRGFAGIYYARTPLLSLAGPFNNFRDPAGDLSIRLPLTVPATNPNNTVYRQLRLIGIDLNNFSLDNLPVITPEQVRQIAAALGFDPLTTGLQPVIMADDFENPKSYQGGLGIERELARGLTVGADFTYVNTVQLLRNRDYNLPLPVVRPTDPAQRPFFGLNEPATSPFRQQRPIPTLGQILVRESTARSLYRALTLRAKFQRSWGQFSAFYTLSKALSDDDNERDATGFRYENAFDVAPEYADSNLDRRHQFVVNPVFFLPFGIDVASAVRLRSGRPIEAFIGSDVNQDSEGRTDRPFRGPGIPFERNAFRNRPTYDVDFRVQKRFNVTENARLIVSLEIFNAINYDNLEFDGGTVQNFCSSPVPMNCGFLDPTNLNFLQLRERNPANPRFGSILLGNNPGLPRQIQLGARFQF